MASKIFFFLNKINKYSLDAQGVGYDLYVNFIEIAYIRVKEGVKKAITDFNDDPELYGYRGLKALYMTSAIKKLFLSSICTEPSILRKINHIKSHGVDYFVLDGKALICFKKMDLKSRISGFYSKRFKDMMSGGVIHYSKTMIDNLAEMGILKPLPIYYVGHVLNKAGNLVDVRLVHYNEGTVAYEVSLQEIFAPNLFNQTITSQTQEDIVVTSKKRKNNKKSGTDK